MKKISIFLAAAVVTFSSFKAIENWKVDKGHARLGFSITHLGISDINGSFKNFDATIKSSKPDFSDAQVELTGDVASINTDIEMRDKHLQGEDFFDAAKYPTFNFVSNGIKPAGKNKYKVTGNLTLHGVTKPVTLDLLYRGTTTNPMSQAATSGFQVTGKIKRSDFNLATGFPTAVLSDEVTIKADGEFVK
ncbi:YceI family protein [Aridibaculum aurantiacum]|uniref:YceI family protein n=1 Tax=Aridibaculum aurantiacum TaxID=2810307 RepID=UPI001A96F9B6|nr:YceI family protein [Aridibaculum aurantiacum]